MHTLILSSGDIQKMVSYYGLDILMDELINRLGIATKQFNSQDTIIPIRSGFNYQKPQTGLVEWMPLYKKGDKVAIKVVGYHPNNPENYQLPTIISTISSYDTATGHLIGITDGVFATALRTGAASAIASRAMAKVKSSVLGLIGCGAQAVTQLHAISRLFPIKEVLLYDVDEASIYSFQERCKVLDLNIKYRSSSIKELVQHSDILCTATSVEVGKGPLFQNLDTLKHLHVNAVGADFPGKVELPLDLLEQSFVCPDFIEQAFKEGECQRLERSKITVDITQVLANPSSYQHLKNQRTVYDSTGWALQDYVVMELFMEYAEKIGVGQFVEIENTPKDAKNPYSFAEKNIAHKITLA
ncbi:MAG: ornithine cyclodeaminase family protein [Bacteroidota bacterium]